MASVGSYVLSTRERPNSEPDPATAPAQIVKLLGQQPRSLAELLSLTGWAEETLRGVVADLTRRGLVEGSDDRLTPTALGFKAQFILAT